MDANDDISGTQSDLLNCARTITKLVYDYQKARGYKQPLGLSGPAWIATELAEVFEVLLGREADWVRNNPEDHENVSDDKLAEELGDIVFMAIYTGIVNGVSPLEAMIKKMYEKSQYKLVYSQPTTLTMVQYDIESKTKLPKWLRRLLQ